MKYCKLASMGAPELKIFQIPNGSKVSVCLQSSPQRNRRSSFPSGSFLVLVSFAVLATVRTDLFGCVSFETVAHCAAS
jgi:hypothetical protein